MERKSIKTWSKVILVLLMAGLCGRGVIAQRAKPNSGGELGDKLDAHLIRATNNGFSGAVLVVKDGRVILSKGYGMANRERKIPITLDTVFDIGSLVKQFTAAAILKLEMKGKLRVTDPINKYFKNVPPDKAAMTIHHLLTHTAGFDAAIGVTMR
jgi:CubicO group peptidase (beta-lactamase class C family)